MKKLIISIVAALTVCAGTATGATVYMNQPEVVARNAVADVIEGFFEREEIAPVLGMVTEGSLELTAKSKMDEEDVPAILADAEAGGKIYFSENAIMLEGFYAKTEGIDLKADAYLSEELAYVTNDDILGGSWGIIRGEMADAFKDSELIEMTGMPEEAEELILKILESYDDNITADLRKDIEKYSEKYLKVVIKAIENNAKYESENDEVKVGGERIDARVIAVTIDAEAAVAIAEEIYDEFKNDKKLRETVLGYLEEYEDLVKENGFVTDDEDFADLYDEMIDEIGDAIDELDEDDEGAIVMEIVTPKLSSKLMKLNLIEKYDGGKTTLLTIDVGEDGVKDSQNISITAGGATISYEITENSSKEYVSAIKVKYGSESTTVAKLTIDKKEDTFKLSIPEGDTTISGNWVSKGKTTTITVNKVKVDEYTVSDFEITLVIKSKDKMPSPEGKKDIKNILSITEEDIEEITSNAGDILGFGAKGDTDVEDSYLEDLLPDFNYSEDVVTPMPEYQH